MNANGEGGSGIPVPISRRVIGCAFAVSNTLGVGFLEAVYENALCIELADQGIRFERQAPLKVSYKGRLVGNYIADLVVEGRLLVELKALKLLTADHEAQVMNYLRASGLSVGLLLNFGAPKLEMRRLVWRHDDADCV
ncbi:GxxExxY protein [uncultured Thiodictyon sp.]|uniref:GxxExxY protein n=1 Tax=uncultured Thiodictyon sp. TaxID=1846217 RepID=UPI0025F10C9A|nr:GxxExxY protein [uncultured Thiodictyon sp.]